MLNFLAIGAGLGTGVGLGKGLTSKPPTPWPSSPMNQALSDEIDRAGGTTPWLNEQVAAANARALSWLVGIVLFVLIAAALGCYVNTLPPPASP